MFKKYFILSFFISVFLFASLPLAILAQTNSLTVNTVGNSTSQNALKPSVKQNTLIEEEINKVRADMNNKIALLKDAKNKDAANKVIAQIDNTNKVWAAHFNDILDKLDAILDKIKSRSQKAVLNGQDATAVNSAIQKASDSIASARLSITNQAQKIYTINKVTIAIPVSTESGQNLLISKLRTQFENVRNQLFKDLMALRDGSIKDARTNVQDALQILSKIPNIDKEPTSNANKY